MTGTKAGTRREARRRCALFALSALLAGSLPAGAQMRDQVPLPRPNPLMTAAASVPATPAQPAAARPQPASAGASSRAALLAGINAYFNSFRTMEGEFVQVGPRGEQSEGTFAISKPGKVRFRFKPPAMLDVIADGSSIAIEDRKARTQDMYPLSRTPLRYLLSDNIDLTSSIVSEIREEQDLISLVIVERSSLVEGRITLIFDRKSFELRQWITTDAQGLNTSVAIFNTRTGTRPDPQLFRIYVQRNRR